MSSQCLKCGAKCCRYFCFEIDEPDTVEEFEDIRWFLFHENISVHVDEGDWYISIENRCKMLVEDGQCRIYEDRPLICRGYDMDDCDFSSADYGYDEEFHTPQELEQYARKVLGDGCFEQRRSKMRVKLEKKQRGKLKKKMESHRHGAQRRRARPAGAIDRQR